MQKLDKNHPRFCARYIRFIGETSVHRIGGIVYCEFNGRYYANVDLQDLKVGDVVYNAKKVKLPGNTWQLHEIIAPEDYWTHEWFCNRPAQYQKTHRYEPRAAYHCSIGETVWLREVSAHFLKQRAFKR